MGRWGPQGGLWSRGRSKLWGAYGMVGMEVPNLEERVDREDKGHEVQRH